MEQDLLNTNTQGIADTSGETDAAPYKIYATKQEYQQDFDAKMGKRLGRLRAMEEDLNVKVKELKVDGGACANNFLMQFQSDVSNVNVIRNSNLESTAMGAGFLAGLASGFIADKSEIMRCGEYTVFSPSISEKTREERLDGWVKAVAKARS